MIPLVKPYLALVMVVLGRGNRSWKQGKVVAVACVDGYGLPLFWVGQAVINGDLWLLVVSVVWER